MTEATAAKKAPAKKAAAPKAAPKAAAKTGKRVRITQLRSAAGRFAYQRATLIGLRLNKIGRVSELEDTPSVRGMIKAVAHLVEFEEVA
jgi:large subunit ribosomal protein L30